jgi:hypothetical protein
MCNGAPCPFKTWGVGEDHPTYRVRVPHRAIRGRHLPDCSSVIGLRPNRAYDSLRSRSPIRKSTSVGAPAPGELTSLLGPRFEMSRILRRDREGTPEDSALKSFQKRDISKTEGRPLVPNGVSRGAHQSRSLAGRRFDSGFGPARLLLLPPVTDHQQPAYVRREGH